jgi:hypothetical protein
MAAGVIGIAVDGQTGPRLMQIGLTREWDATFYFGRTKRGKVVISRLVIGTGRADGQLPEDQELPMAVIRKITIARVQHYLEQVNRPTQEPKVKRPRANSRIKTAQDLKRLLVRYDQIAQKNPRAAAKILAIELRENRNTVRTWIRRARGL